MKKRLYSLIAAIVLTMAFFFIRFNPISHHPMTGLTLTLYLASLAVIAIAAYLNKNIFSIVVTFGYIFGYFISYAYKEEFINDAGRLNSTMLYIWVGVWLLFVVIGFFVQKEIVKRKL